MFESQPKRKILRIDVTTQIEKKIKYSQNRLQRVFLKENLFGKPTNTYRSQNSF